jgi:hypothetical protein
LRPSIYSRHQSIEKIDAPTGGISAAASDPAPSIGVP